MWKSIYLSSYHFNSHLHTPEHTILSKYQFESRRNWVRCNLSNWLGKMKAHYTKHKNFPWVVSEKLVWKEIFLLSLYTRFLNIDIFLNLTCHWYVLYIHKDLHIRSRQLYQFSQDEHILEASTQMAATFWKLFILCFQLYSFLGNSTLYLIVNLEGLVN